MDTLNWRGLETLLVQVLMLTNAVIGKECKDAVSVGSLKQDNIDHNAIVTEGQTFILAGYVIPCSGTVVAWEFCHRISSVTSATFYPGIWSNASDLSTDYRLIQSTNVTFDTTGNDVINKCQRFNVSIMDQFTAPIGSFVGLYSNTNAQLLHTNTSGSITTYQFDGNQSSGSYDDVHYNIAIRVYLDSMTSTSSAVPMIWIIAGGTVGLLVSTLLIISLISVYWHRRKRRRRNQYQTLHDCGTVHSVGSDDYSKNTITSHRDVTTHGHICINHSSSVNTVSAPYPCLEPSTPANEALPILSVHRELKHVSDYEATVGSADNPSEDLKQDGTVAPYRHSTGNGISNEKLHQDDQIYEDPGCHKETLYSWFEKRKIKKIRIKDIRMEQKIGAGEFGVVSLGVWCDGSADSVQVAVKTLNSQCSESDRVKFLREAAIMGQFVHNNVVQLHGVVTEENMMIVLEYMSKRDLLANLLHIKSTISQETCYQVSCNLVRFCRQIAAGLSYLASKQFVHRDLAARNILVSSDDVCKIADFGMARDVGDSSCYVSKGGKIPLKWTAPEAIIHNKYSTQSDVWSFGCILYEIWSLGHAPFEDIDGRECVEKLTIGYRLPPPPGCPRAIYELMIKCWHPDSQHRPLPEAIHQTLKCDDTSLLTSTTDVIANGEDNPMILGNPLAAGSQLYGSLQQMYRVIV